MKFYAKERESAWHAVSRSGEPILTNNVGQTST